MAQSIIRQTAVLIVTPRPFRTCSGRGLLPLLDGSRMLAAASPRGEFISPAISASNWSAGPNPPLPAMWHSVCTSSDGKRVGVLGNATYISSDSGVSWRTNPITGSTIACSANGTNWIIAGTHIFTSSDAGITWQTNLSNAQWLGGTVSADGCEMVAVGSGQGTWLGLRNHFSATLH